MDIRIGLWRSAFWDWFLPGLAALEPMVGAYSAAYFEERPASGFTEPAEHQSAGNARVVIPGRFQPAEASR